MARARTTTPLLPNAGRNGAPSTFDGSVLTLGGAASGFLDFLFRRAAFVGAGSLGSSLFARCALGGLAFFLGESSGVGHFFGFPLRMKSARERGWAVMSGGRVRENG